MKKYVAILSVEEKQTDPVDLTVSTGIQEVWAESPEALIEGVAERLGLSIIVTEGREESGAV